MFGPESVSWPVNRETPVLFGGARALLMQAAHPLVLAGARQTGASGTLSVAEASTIRTAASRLLTAFAYSRRCRYRLPRLLAARSFCFASPLARTMS